MESLGEVPDLIRIQGERNAPSRFLTPVAVDEPASDATDGVGTQTLPPSFEPSTEDLLSNPRMQLVESSEVEISTDELLNWEMPSND